MATRETKLNIVVEAQNRATNGLAQVERSLGSFNMNVEKVSEGLRTVGKYGAVAFATLSAATAKLVSDSADALQIEESYRRMTAQVGISADELVAKLREVSAGTVSTTDLMLSSNRAMALGVADNMETVTQLMEIARLKGRALGLTTTQAFNDIVTGIGRGSPLILDNLGITIKLGEAQELYAQKLGKTSEELTDAEKKQALLNAVLESGNAEVAAAGDLSATTAEKLQAMKAQFADTADTLGRTLIPAVTKLLEAITPLLQKVASWIEENPKLASAIILAGLAVSALAVALGALGVILPLVAVGMAALAGPAGLIIAILAALGFAVYKVVGIMDMLMNHWKEVWVGMKLIAVDAANGVIGIVEGMVNKMIESINGLISRINKMINRASSLTGIELPTLGSLDSFKLDRIGTEGIISSADFSTPSAPPVVISGNTFLSEDVAEQVGDLIMKKLKLSNAI